MSELTFIGLDVHARSVAAGVLDGVSGKVRSCAAPVHTAELVEWLRRHGEAVSVAYEAGPTGYGLARAQRQLDDQAEKAEVWSDTGYVFTKESGDALHPQMVSRAFAQAIAAAKLPEIRLHDLRHTHASLALAAGINPKVISERLGHATIAITLDTYSHAIPAMQEGAAALIAGLVFTER